MKDKKHEKYRRSLNGKIKKIYYSQKSSSNKRGHILPQYTEQEFLYYCTNSKKFNILFKMWKLSGYNKWLAPSIDRINDNLTYSFDNIQILTWYENDFKGRYIQNTKNKEVLQICLNSGNTINAFKSMSEASIKTNSMISKISLVCNGKRSKHNGFNWKFKK